MPGLLKCVGSTSTGSRIEPGVFLKSPIDTNHEAVARQVKAAFSIEVPILRRLGSHPRIVRYLGEQGKGLLLGEASHGNLQAFINLNNPSIGLSQRRKWCHQAVEAVTYIHSRGVIHSDLRPENFLVHETSPGSLDLLLCDFGGAVCNELGLDGNQLPNDPFYDPNQGVEITPALDIFSLGSVFYTILTGYWPYRTRTFFSKGDDYLDYTDRVHSLFKQRQYPDVTGLDGGRVVLGCWTKEFTTAEHILDALYPVTATALGTASFTPPCQFIAITIEAKLTIEGKEWEFVPRIRQIFTEFVFDDTDLLRGAMNAMLKGVASERQVVQELQK